MIANLRPDAFGRPEELEIVKQAHRRAVECMKLSGEGAEDAQLNEKMARHISHAAHTTRELNFLKLLTALSTGIVPMKWPEKKAMKP